LGNRRLYPEAHALRARLNRKPLGPCAQTLVKCKLRVKESAPLTIVMAKKRLPDNLQIWIDARKKYHLSHTHLQMARELGMNPKKFGSLANHKQERWKLPLPQFIEQLYFKRFGKSKLDRVVSIEEVAKEIKRKKEEKGQNKALKQGSEIKPTAGDRSVEQQ